MDRLLSLLIILLLAFQGVALAKQDPYAEVRELASELAYILVSDYDIPSAEYALISNGEIVISGLALSKNENGSDAASMSNQTIYGIGSVSKMFATTAVLLLVDDGKLDLDEPVATYIPEFKMADERYKDITVRMLLNHSSGILGTLMFSTMTYGIPSTRYHDSLLPQLAKQRLKADPGEFSVYCNDGFSLAEIIVERVSGMSFSEFVRQRITESVGMTNTKTPQDDFDRTRMARTFFQGEITPYDNCNAIGLGGVYSTAEDLCKLAQAYMDDPGSVAAAELLSDEMRTASMQKEYLRGIWPEPGEGVIGYGLGWDSVGPNFFSEYGIQALLTGLGFGWPQLLQRIRHTGPFQRRRHSSVSQFTDGPA